MPFPRLASRSPETTPRPPLLIIFLTSSLEDRLTWSCEPLDTIGDLKIGIAILLLTETDLLVLRHRTGQEPLRDELTMSSYGVTDGSSLDLKLIKVEA